MCGIVGYSGSEAKAKEVILSGLEKLEYRGYDSSGIAIVLDNQQLFIEKKKGKLAVLKEYMEKKFHRRRKNRHWAYKMGNTWNSDG